MLFCSIFDISGQIKMTLSYKTEPPTFYGCQRFKMSSGDLNKSSGDYLRIEICPCESLLVICMGRSTGDPSTNWLQLLEKFPLKGKLCFSLHWSLIYVNCHV